MVDADLPRVRRILTGRLDRLATDQERLAELAGQRLAALCDVHGIAQSGELQALLVAHGTCERAIVTPGTDPAGAAFYWAIDSVQADRHKMEEAMLYWAAIFLVIALVAALFGFGGVASASAGIAQILFFVFLVLLVISVVMYVVRGRRPPV